MKQVGAVKPFFLPSPIHACSPVFLMQVLYKVLFLGHLVATGQLTSAPAAPTAVFFSYLLPLFTCSPWSYLLGGGSMRAKAE